MDPFESEIQSDIDWRFNEISVLRMLPYNSHLKDYQKDVVIKYSTVALYALWEGFVITSLSLYIRKINEIGLKHEKIHISLITHDIDCKLQLQDGRQYFEKKKKLVEDFQKYFDTPPSLSVSIPIDNVNLKQLNGILSRLNIPQMDVSFKGKLDKLVMIRNDVAHGEDSIPTNIELIEELRITVIDAISELALIVIEAYQKQSFLRDNPRP